MEIKKDVCLKNIIKNKLNEFDKKSSLIFTTFDYDTAFFETQLLPFLFDAENYSKSLVKGKLVAHELHQKLKEIDLKVFYNHFKDDIQADVNFKSFENPTNKLLHAKLIIIIGKKKEKKSMAVIVSSANLTTSSYGTNLEVVGVIENNDESIINKIEGSDSLENILSSLNKIKELAITGIGKENKVENELNSSNTINVITPFIEEKIIESYKNKELNIIFTNLRGLKDKHKYKKYNFIRTYPKYERKIHSKMYLLDGRKIILGSHNFTTNAIKGINIEASLIIENKELYKNGKACFDKINGKCSDLKDIVDTNEINEMQELEIKVSKNIFVSKAEIDWENEKILFELKSKLNKSYEIKSARIENLGLKWTNIKFDNNKNSWNLEEKINEKTKDIIFENKFFEMKVIIKNNKEETLTGIIYEKDPIDPIEKIKEKNFNDILNFYFTNNVNFLDTEEDDFLQEVEFKKTNNSSNMDNEEAEIYNITDMFLAFKKLNKEVDSYIDKNETDKTKEFYVTNSKSIKRLSYLLNKYYEDEENIAKSKRKVLYFLLTSNEISILWNKESEFLNKLKTDEEINSIIKRNETNLNELKEFSINLMKENNSSINSLEKSEQEMLLNLFLEKF